MRAIIKYLGLIIFLCYLSRPSLGQEIDHWETAIYNTDQWHFFIGNQEPPSLWSTKNFDDASWQTGNGGIGYGDDDDSTIIAPTLSLYMRKSFQVDDVDNIKNIVLHADFDDAFVAYINGEEIARSNIGLIGTPPKFDETATTWKEAQMYQGGNPEAFIVPVTTLNKGQNILAIQVHNESISSSDLSCHFFLSFGIAVESKLYRPTPSWFEEPFSSSNLPLLFITTTGSQIRDEPRVTAHLGIIDNGIGKRNNFTDSFNGYDGNIAIEIRGASSQGFPKKNYGFETQLENGENNNVSLLSMPSENDWVLHGPYADKSLLRNTLAYHMGRSTGRYAPRTRFCEVIIDDDYQGLYMLTERIKRDKNRVDIANLKKEDVSGDELTGGYILQIDRDDEENSEDGWTSSYPDYKFYAYDDPDWDDLLPVQKNYIKGYINSFEYAMDHTDYLNQYQKFVDVESWVDYFLVTEVGKHIDAYKLSFYLYKEKNSKGGKLHFGPLWDFNLGFGNFDFACSPDPEGWSYLFGDDCSKWLPFWSKKLTNIPQVSDQINCRWAELRNGPFHTDSLLEFINIKTNYIKEARIRNFEKWPILGTYVWPNDYVGDNYEDESNFLKNWLIERLDWMDNNMIGDCENLVYIESQDIERGLQIYPNPASNLLNVSFSDNSTETGQFTLYNTMGQQVLTISILNAPSTISIDHLPNGTYTYSFDRQGKLKQHGRIQIIR